MKRFHLFEFLDQPWYPEIFRCIQTDYLQFVATRGAGHENLVPLIAKALQQVGRDPQHTNFTPDSPSPPYEGEWAVDFSPEIIYSAQPVIAEEAVYVTTLQGTLYALAADTGARKWGRPYLNRAFFRLLGEKMADRVLLIMATRGDVIIAGALNLIGHDALYGRYWGCAEDVRFLHFELCYHQAVEAAIELGLARVEAGAQGEHKIARGYLPTLTHSAHFIADPGLREAVAGFLGHERRAVAHEFELLMQESPYRQGGGPG